MTILLFHYPLELLGLLARHGVIRSPQDSWPWRLNASFAKNVEPGYKRFPINPFNRWSSLLWCAYVVMDMIGTLRAFCEIRGQISTVRQQVRFSEREMAGIAERESTSSPPHFEPVHVAAPVSSPEAQGPLPNVDVPPRNLNLNLHFDSLTAATGTDTSTFNSTYADTSTEKHLLKQELDFLKEDEKDARARMLSSLCDLLLALDSAGMLAVWRGKGVFRMGRSVYPHAEVLPDWLVGVLGITSSLVHLGLSWRKLISH
ncbi:hypothetical protein HK102_013224 [Quaeritorhiza haematococci]|nr:hypothetical protein HK102_013224 [Quaeritorhiza haematococci]